MRINALTWDRHGAHMTMDSDTPLNKQDKFWTSIFLNTLMMMMVMIIIITNNDNNNNNNNKRLHSFSAYLRFSMITK